MNEQEVLALVLGMSDHLHYMHGLLADPEQGDLDDYHWHREAIRLRGMAAQFAQKSRP